MEDVIIDLARQGDPSAFSQLVQRYSKRVYLSVLAVLGNQVEAQDVTQEVFILLMRKFSLYDPRYPFYPWLYRLARNTALNWLKKRKEGEAEYQESASLSPYDVPEEGYLKKEAADELWQTLQSLDLNSREILQLKYYQDCSYKEIAEILQIPVGTVMSRLYSAKQRLKEQMLKREGMTK